MELRVYVDDPILMWQGLVDHGGKGGDEEFIAYHNFLVFCYVL